MIQTQPFSLRRDPDGYSTYADFDVETDWLPYSKIPPLNRAVLQNDLVNVQSFLRGRHNPNLALAGEIPIETPIFVATRNGNHDIMKALLGHGAKPDGEAREWPLAEAVRQGDETAVSILLNARAKIDKSPKFRPIFYYAARYDQMGLAPTLTKAGAGIDQPDHDGHSAMHHAVMDGDMRAASRLLVAGAGADRTNQYGETPLYLAVLAKDLAMAGLLVSYGASPNIPNSEGRYPLHQALKTDDRLAMMLLDAGADPNLAAPDGRYPLIDAAQQGKVAIVDGLLAAGADPQVMKKDGVWADLVALNHLRPKTFIHLRAAGDNHINIGAWRQRRARLAMQRGTKADYGFPAKIG